MNIKERMREMWSGIKEVGKEFIEPNPDSEDLSNSPEVLAAMKLSEGREEELKSMFRESVKSKGKSQEWQASNSKKVKAKQKEKQQEDREEDLVK